MGESEGDINALLEPLLSQDRTQNSGRRQRHGTAHILNTATPREKRPYGVYMNPHITLGTSTTSRQSRSEETPDTFLPWALPQSVSCLTENAPKTSKSKIRSFHKTGLDGSFSFANSNNQTYREDE